MIFVSVGNHNQEFTRLIKHLDLLAPKIKEKIIIQRGYSNYVPKNCENFRWDSSLENYMKKASLIITHAGIGTTLEVLKKYKKPCIVVPRRHELDEHINNHQVEFGKVLEEKGVKVINKMNELDENILKKYRKVVNVENKSFKNLQDFLRKIISQVEKKYE